MVTGLYWKKFTDCKADRFSRKETVGPFHSFASTHFNFQHSKSSSIPPFHPSVSLFSLFESLSFILSNTLLLHPLFIQSLAFHLYQSSRPFLSSSRISQVAVPLSSSPLLPLRSLPVRIRAIEFPPVGFLTRLFIPDPTTVASCPLGRRLERGINSGGRLINRVVKTNVWSDR